MPHLYRRFAYFAPGQSAVGEVDGHRHGAASRSSGPPVEDLEGSMGTEPGIHMPRVSVGHVANASGGSSQAHQGHTAVWRSNSKDGSSRKTHPDEGRSSPGGTNYFDDAGYPSGETSPAIPTTRPGQGSKEDRLERPRGAVEAGTLGTGLVAGHQPLEDQWERHRGSDPSSAGHIAHRRSNEQCGFRGRDDLQRSEIRHAGLPDADRTSGTLHKRVRILRDAEHSAGPFAGSNSGQNPLAYSPHLSGIGQPHVREVRDGGGVQIDQNVGERGRLLRLERAARISRELSVARGSPQCAGGPAFAPPEQSCRLATSPMAFSPGDERLSNASGCGSVCVVSKLPTPQLLCFSPRSSRGGSRRFQFQVDSAPVPLRISSSDSDIAHSAENDSRAPANDGAASASMDGTNLVANTHVDDVGPSDTTSQRRLDHSGPDGQPDVAVPMASSRILFIRRFAAGNGISQKVLERRWSDIKNGYNKAYDKPFEAFRVWFETTHPDDEFSPTTISSGLLCDYLLYLKEDRGVHYDLIRYASSSISMACAIATDGEIQQGNSPSVTALLKGFRIHRPIKLKGTSGTYSDVVLLYEQAWLYGPTSALTPRHKRERALILLAADTACRPSDLCKLFRVFEGTQRQIVYSETGMRIRFFWPKEADPGSARQNTTNYFFSKWVEVHDTLPAVISTPAVLRDFIIARVQNSHSSIFRIWSRGHNP